MSTLRKLDAFDTPWVVQWRNQNRHYFSDQAELTAQGHRAWFYETYMNDPADHMYIVQNSAGIGCGTIGIRMPTGEIQRVLLGDRETAEPGLMSTALQELMGIYGKRYYWLKVYSDNARAIRFYQKNGFVDVNRDDNTWTHMGLYT